jgi:hypothetical protein
MKSRSIRNLFAIAALCSSMVALSPAYAQTPDPKFTMNVEVIQWDTGYGSSFENCVPNFINIGDSPDNTYVYAACLDGAVTQPDPNTTRISSNQPIIGETLVSDGADPVEVFNCLLTYDRTEATSYNGEFYVTRDIVIECGTPGFLTTEGRTRIRRQF